MTVGIGLLCSDGRDANKILLAADMRASYGTVSSNDQTAKLTELPKFYAAALAGKISQCEDVIAELHYRMEQITEPEIAPELVRRAISDSYFKVYTEMAEQELRNGPRITLDQFWHDSALVPSVRQAADRILKLIEVDVSLIVAGFYRNTPVQFVAEGGATVDVRAEITPGNAVIGSGQMAALNWLNYRKQNWSLGLAQSLLHLTEAKQFSEVEQTVGPLRQTILLWHGGRKALNWTTEAQNLLQGWWHKFGLPLSDGLKDEKYNQNVRDIFGITQ